MQVDSASLGDFLGSPWAHPRCTHIANHMLGAWQDSADSEAWPTWLGDKESVQVGEVGEVSSRSWPVAKMCGWILPLRAGRHSTTN